MRKGDGNLHGEEEATNISATTTSGNGKIQLSRNPSFSQSMEQEEGSTTPSELGKENPFGSRLFYKRRTHLNVPAKGVLTSGDISNPYRNSPQKNEVTGKDEENGWNTVTRRRQGKNKERSSGNPLKQSTAAQQHHTFIRKRKAFEGEARPQQNNAPPSCFPPPTHGVPRFTPGSTRKVGKISILLPEAKARNVSWIMLNP